MTHIRLLVQPQGAPGCIVILPAENTYNLGQDDGSILLQNDQDWQALAEYLGMDEDLDAWQWLSDHDGEAFEDPGYFNE